MNHERLKMADNFDWLILDRYLTNEITAGELALLQQWLAGDDSRARLLAAFVVERDRKKAEPDWDLSELRNRISDRTSPLPLRNQSEPKPTPLRTFPRTLARKRSPWVHASVISAAIAVVGIIGLGVLRDWPANVFTTSAVKMKEYSTPRGQLASIYLGDGTRVVLAPDSRLLVPESIGNRSPAAPAFDRREVKLQGAAYFDVVHDETRPFSVVTAAGVVRDLGTQFEVRLYEPARPMEVTVVSGVVEMQSIATTRASAATLRKGDRGTLSPNGNFTITKNVDLKPTLGWTKGMLVFDRVPLRQVIREVSRWYDVDIELGAGADPDRRLVLTLDNESASDALSLIALSLGLRIESHGHRSTLTSQ
jgi:transmembrane sensor